MEGNPEFAEIYGTSLAITASGNSQPVVSTAEPLPETCPILANPPGETGAVTLWLLRS